VDGSDGLSGGVDEHWHVLWHCGRVAEWLHDGLMELRVVGRCGNVNGCRGVGSLGGRVVVFLSFSRLLLVLKVLQFESSLIRELHAVNNAKEAHDAKGLDEGAEADDDVEDEERHVEERCGRHGDHGAVANHEVEGAGSENHVEEDEETEPDASAALDGNHAEQADEREEEPGVGEEAEEDQTHDHG